MAAQQVTQVAAAQWSADTVTLLDTDPVQQIASADPSRRELTIYTDPSSIGTLYLVPGAGQRTGGVRVAPGAGVSMHHAAPVYGYSLGGFVSINVLSERGAVC